MRCRRGDIVLVFFPNSDLRSAKRRPVLVVSDDLETDLPQVIVAMISSNLARVGHQSRVAIRITDRGFGETGLLIDSVVLPDNLATVLETEVDRKIGRLADLSEVEAALRHTLGL